MEQARSLDSAFPLSHRDPRTGLWSTRGTLCALAALATAITGRAQDAPRLPPLPVGFQPEGVAVFLHTKPPQPLFTSALGLQGKDGTLEATLDDYGTPGLLAFFVGSPRPLSTMLDIERYCTLSGVRTDLDALCTLVADGGKPTNARAGFDRLAAVVLLADHASEQARKALATASKSDDRMLALWAERQLARTTKGASTWSLPIEGLTAALATAPADAGAVIYVDNLRAPEWRKAWGIAKATRQAMQARWLAGVTRVDDRTEAMLEWFERQSARGDLFAYELAHRFGNACFARTLIVSPSLTRRGSFMSWCRRDGLLAQDAIAAGLRAEGVAVDSKDGVVEGRLAERLSVRATSTSITLEEDGTAARLSAEQAQKLADTLGGPSVMLAIEFVRPDFFGEVPLPEPAKPILDTLRRIVLRHDPGPIPKVRLELHYDDKKAATVASAALGALLTMAKANSDQAPASAREALRELQVSCEGAVTVAEAELDTSLATVLEDCLSLMAR